MLPRTQYVDSDGHSIAYQVIGSGPVDAFFEPGLLSHLDLQVCDPLFGGFLHQLASSSRLIITDQRGVGLSDACATIPRSTSVSPTWWQSPMRLVLNRCS
jgi:hypothetical protein